MSILTFIHFTYSWYQKDKISIISIWSFKKCFYGLLSECSTAQEIAGKLVLGCRNGLQSQRFNLSSVRTSSAWLKKREWQKSVKGSDWLWSGRKHVINPYLIQVVSGAVMLTGCAEKSAPVHNSESTLKEHWS